jgi:hypothetical protein
VNATPPGTNSVFKSSSLSVSATPPGTNFVHRDGSGRYDCFSPRQDSKIASWVLHGRGLLLRFERTHFQSNPMGSSSFIPFFVFEPSGA